MACMGRTSRSRRPCARGEVLCTEPGKSHPCPDRQAGPVHEGNSRTMNMHADENSDGVIVPEKRSNNEGVSSAETVEGRTSPKGNGGRTAAARTLAPGYRVERTHRRAPSGATEQECTVHCTAASHHHRSPEAELPFARKGFRAGYRRRDVADLRREPRREAEGPAR